MTTKKDSRQLELYSQSLRAKTYTFACPDCGQFFLPKHYEDHCSKKHQFNAKLGCVWCRQHFWKSGTKCDFADHLRTCSRKFLLLSRIAPSTTTSTDRASPTGPLRLLKFHYKDLENDSFDIPHDLPPSAQMCPFPPDIDRFPKTYSDDNMHLALCYVRLYLEYQNTFDWLHVMVKAVAFDSFVRAMELDQGNSQTLLFACWCDGGSYEEARHRQHRHMIVCSQPKGHFLADVWPKVQAPVDDKPCPNFPCKRLKVIHSPMHFVNTLGYLSHRKSRCAFSFKRNTAPLNEAHFLLRKALPIEFRLPLVLLWDEGISQLLHIEKFQNVSMTRMLEAPVVFDNGQWKQRYKDFYGHECGWVLPVYKDLTPTPHTTPHAFSLPGGRKLYFEECPENLLLDQESWLRRQAEGGNCFYDCVAEEYWIPRPKHQKELNKMKPLVYRIKALECEITDLKTRSQNEIHALREDNLLKQATILEQYVEIQRLHNKLHDLNEEKMDKLVLENEQLREEVRLLKLKIFELEARLAHSP